MKNLLTLLFIVLPWVVYAQNATLPFDSTTGRILFTNIVEVDNSSKDVLYNKARTWFSTHFNSGETVLDMDEKALGKLIGKAALPFKFQNTTGGGLFTERYILWYTLIVEIKNGRYRYEITNLEIKVPDYATISDQVPIESLYLYKGPQEKHYTKKGKLTANGVHLQRTQSAFNNSITESINSLIESLRKEMMQPKEAW